MKTIDCQCADASAAPPDPRKHVHYVHGMVLGKDDLIQEFAYHQEQRQWLARDAIGYGTLNGLRVEKFTDPQKGIQLAVNPGTALSPRGQLIRVAPKQCASVNDWLASVKEKVEHLGPNFDVYLVLCFRDCKVDPLPVPGEPCRCEDQAKAPSRILDDFRLELRFALPAHREEKAIRVFVNWLRKVKVSDVPASPSGEAIRAFVDALRVAFAVDETSPPASPPLDLPIGPPPADLAIPAGELCEYLRAALRFWVVELRPRWQAQWTSRTGGGCECHAGEKTTEYKSEECLLLARVNLTLTNGLVAAEDDVVVDDSERPFVTHLRMLQEMLLCGPCGGGGCHDRTLATAFALDEQTIRIWLHHAQPVALDSSAVQLTIDDVAVSGFTITQFTSPDFGQNVFDLALPGGSPATALQHGQRIELTLNTRLVMELTSPRRSLADALAESGTCIPDVTDGIARIYGAVANPGSSAGAIHHGGLTGLLNDDHPQYHTDVRGDARYALINHTHALDDLSDVVAPNPNKEDHLKFDGNRWIPAAAEAYHVHTGVVFFTDMKAGEARTSKAIKHRFGKQKVCIRLGIQFRENEVLSEDTDSLFPGMSPSSNLPLARVVARWNTQADDTFTILIRDVRDGGQARNWRVRWWGFPIADADDFGEENGGQG